jgi:hypothetical protein
MMYLSILFNVAFFRDYPGISEPTYFDQTLFVNQDMLWFQIPVHHVSRVDEFYWAQKIIKKAYNNILAYFSLNQLP